MVWLPVKLKLRARELWSTLPNDVEGLGRFVVLSHDQGYKTTYAHLQEVLVSVGTQVKQGETIALLGESVV